MKKLILSILLLPMMAFGATTNKLDNILNTGTFQRPTGAGVGNIWTSDAAGFGTWALPSAATGPFAVTNADNFFISSSINTFNAPTFTSNMFVRGYLGINTNGPLSGIYPLQILPAPGQIHAFIALRDNGSGGELGIDYQRGAVTYTLGIDGLNNFRLAMGGSASFIVRDDGQDAIIANDSSVTLNDSASDTFTVNGSTFTWAHAPQINSNVLKIPLAGGTITNGTSLTTLGTLKGHTNIIGEAGIPIALSGATNFVWTPGNIATLATAVTNVSVSGITKGSAVMMSPNVFVSGLIWKSYCTNDGVVTGTINNFTALGIDPGVHTNHIRFFNP